MKYPMDSNGTDSVSLQRLQPGVISTKTSKVMWLHLHLQIKNMIGFGFCAV